ncbi:MAG: NAD(P)/FAD-dependent oxidoreductase [Eubacteriales bacterium]
MKEIQKLTVGGIRVTYRPGEDADASAIHKAASLLYRKTGVKPKNLQIAKKSIDARRRAELSFVYTVYAEMEVRMSVLENDPDIRRFTEPELHLTHGTRPLEHRPVIVGFGPAGMFAALVLAENGFRPILLERGASVDERVAAVERFTKEGILDPDTNVQFGAGGAGTFSDGKLTTRIGDPAIAYVLHKLHELGAPADIEYKAKPHIGTDILRSVVREADRVITSLGGEIHYKTKVTDITDTTVTAGGTVLPYRVLILATGHSARDTYAELLGKGYIIEPKPFSVGVRAEHLQEEIDAAMFGSHAGDRTLGHAEYQLSFREGERGCYTFCMCPGGTVVPSASEEGGIVTNGMSTRARDGRNANAAVCVSVRPEDFGSTPAGAIEFQKSLEQRAYQMAGSTGAAPMQTVGDFLRKTHGTEYSRIVPTYRGGFVTPCDFDDLFPPFVTDLLRKGLVDFGRKIKGYDASDVPLTGVETRTSAPVRILRNEGLTAPGHPGVYPSGEGAGYAGGIVSAAVDGIRVASKIIAEYAP